MQQVIQFIKEVAAEFKKITWPKKEALIQLTVVVISISIVISLILGGFDYLFTNSISLLGKINQPNTNLQQPLDTTSSAVSTESAQVQISITSTPVKK